MKVSGAILSLALIIAALCCQVHASPDGPSTPTICCFEFTTQIPLKFVVSYVITSSRCAKDGLVFVTRRGKQVCTNPKEQWVQDIKNYLDRKNAKTQSP